MAVSGTGNKQYDNPPNNVAAAMPTGLLLYRLSDDPLVKAEGLAMARRAAYWWNLARTGPLEIGDYYKGMFWTTAWAGLGLAELTTTDPNGPWNQWSADLAQSFRQAQLSSGAWTWVDEGSGKQGTSNDRNNRSRDNRQLNCGDLLLAMSRLAKATGADIGDAERKAGAFLSKTLASPPEWFFNGNAGVVRIVARQEGNEKYKPASPVERAFAVGAAHPNRPSDLIAAPLATDTIRLRWKDNAESETGYRVEMGRPGDHILQFGCREATGRIDRVIVTNGTASPQ
jgi:hypothetical protein